MAPRQAGPLSLSEPEVSAPTRPAAPAMAATPLRGQQRPRRTRSPAPTRAESGVPSARADLAPSAEPDPRQAIPSAAGRVGPESDTTLYRHLGSAPLPNAMAPDQSTTIGTSPPTPATEEPLRRRQPVASPSQEDQPRPSRAEGRPQATPAMPPTLARRPRAAAPSTPTSPTPGPSHEMRPPLGESGACLSTPTFDARPSDAAPRFQLSPPYDPDRRGQPPLHSAPEPDNAFTTDWPLLPDTPNAPNEAHAGARLPQPISPETDIATRQERPTRPLSESPRTAPAGVAWKQPAERRDDDGHRSRPHAAAEHTVASTPVAWPVLDSEPATQAARQNIVDRWPALPSESTTSAAAMDQLALMRALAEAERCRRLDHEQRGTAWNG